MIKVRSICCLLILSLFCCRKPYNPPAIASPDDYLVVEGIINSGSDSTVIKLSKIVNVNSKKTSNPVQGASVAVESDAGGTWPLAADGTGRYGSPTLGLLSLQKYRLNIKTNDGLQYLSDFEPVKPTPPIDSIGYVIKNGALQLYVNAHDASNNTRYYRWDYNETWAFHSKYPSSYIVDTLTNIVLVRRPDQQVFNCFGNDVSSNIFLGSTVNLSRDIIYQSSLTNIPLTSEKFENEYTIIVRQYALTADAYQFYSLMKKNTNELGGIFGELPSELTGNIHCVNNTSKLAIGYISVTNIQSKRIFIFNSALPSGINAIYPYDCAIDTALSFEYFLTPPYNDVPIELLNKGGVLYSSKECVDCTIRGTTKVPSFWK